MNSTFEDAQKIIQNGGLALLPTDTTYIITCRIDNEEALKRLFAVKDRAATQAVPVLVSSIIMAKEYVSNWTDKIEKNLVYVYWPGALTIILPCQTEKVLPLLRGQGKTLGIRQPHYPELLSLIEHIGVPIVGTSGNFHGKPTAYTFETLDPQLIKKVDCVVQGKPFAGGASTVIDCSAHPWKILRQGAVNIPEKMLY